MKPVQVAIAIIHRQGRCFAQRRDPAARVLPGLWEFPGGKLEAGEAPETALLRELREEIHWTPAGVRALPSLLHPQGQPELAIHPFLCHGAGQLRTSLAWGWFTADELWALPMPAANFALLENLNNYL